MTVECLALSPTRLKLGAGTYMIKQIKELGKGMNVRRLPFLTVFDRPIHPYTV